MPRASSAKIKNLKNLNKFKNNYAKMETDQSSDEDDDQYDPIIEAHNTNSVLGETDISEEFLVRLLEMVINESSIRNISIFTFGILTKFGINISAIGNIFLNIGLQKAEHCRENLIKFYKDGTDINSGGNRFCTFYENFPEIEIAAKVFVTENCSKKSCSFRVLDLCKYIDTMFYEITNTEKENDLLVRSESAVRQDLKNWGLEYGSPSNIYFEGHERTDVVEGREQFIDHFLERKDHFYTLTESDCDEINWIEPTEKPCVLLCHDESTFRCGEQTAKRWIMEGKEPFISKGRGRSLMVSDFLVAHPSGPFFQLSDIEWDNCIKKYPDIVNFQGVNYVEKTCTGSIEPGQGNYFSAETVLEQFERLFQMIEFKTVFNHPVKHDIEIIVDNARTHTAQVVNINDFRLRPGGYCPVKVINYTDISGQNKIIECFDELGISKGLKTIASEIGYELPDNIKVAEVRSILLEHPAFAPAKKLTKLAEKYGIKIIFCPKYHCELNPCEGLWCNQKQYTRKRTDQTFIKLHQLLIESREHFIQIQLTKKLFRRFWNCLIAYRNGATYSYIMTQYFSGKSTGKNTSHTKIANSQLQ